MLILIIFILLLIIICLICLIKHLVKWADANAKKYDKCNHYYILLNHWLKVKQRGIKIEAYFEQNNINSVAIYGMGLLGHRLYDEIKDSGIHINVLVDQNPNAIYCECPVLKPEIGLKDIDVDILVVTVPVNFDVVKRYMNNEVRMMYLEDIINAL